MSKDIKNSFDTAAPYKDWEKDPIWKHFLQQQKKFKRPRTKLVNELMHSVPNGTRKEFLRRIGRASKLKDSITFERHALGVAFAMQRLSTMMHRRKNYMQLTSEPLEIRHQAGYLSYRDEDAAPTTKPLTIIDNFTIRKDDKPFIYKAKYTPVRRFGEIDPNAQDSHYDYNLLLKYNEAVEQGLICGAAIEIRGLIDPHFIDWACGTSVFERGDIPHVQLIYNMPLPSGAEYRFTFKKAETLAEELDIANKSDTYTAEDMAVIHGIQNALRTGNQLQLNEIMTGQSVFSQKGDLKSEFQQFSCPLREAELSDPTFYDNYLEIMKTGIWRRAANIKPEFYNHDKDTIFSPENLDIENDTHALSARLETFQTELRQSASIIKDRLLGDNPDSPEYAEIFQDVVMTFSRNIAHIRELEKQRRIDEMNMPSLINNRRHKGWHGLENGYQMTLHFIMVDSIDIVKNKRAENVKDKSYTHPEGRFMDTNALLDMLETRKDEHNTTLIVYNPKASQKQKKRQSFSQPTEEQIQRETILANRENIKALSQFFVAVGKGTEKLNAEERARFKKRKKQILGIQAEMASMGQERMEISKSMGAEAKKLGLKKLPPEHPIPQRMNELQQQKLQAEARLYDTYKGILNSQRELSLLRSIHSYEKNIIKLVYSVDHKGDITFEEEPLAYERATRRASHSELVDGGGVFGAGEIILEKSPDSKNWQIIEINNGSGHYRPPSDTLRYVANCMISHLREAYIARGMPANDAEDAMKNMMKKARLTDTIARGITLRDQELDLRQRLNAKPKTLTQDAKSPVQKRIMP